MSDKKFVLLDTRHQVQVVLDYLTHLQQQQPLVGLAQPNKVMALNMVQTLVAEIIEQRDKSIPDGMGVDWPVVRAAILFGTTPNDVFQRQIKFLERVFREDILDTCRSDLNHQVNAHEKLVSYNSWEVINTGTMIAIVEKGDSRILQWEELRDEENDSYITLDMSRVLEDLHTEFEKNFGPYPQSQIAAMLLETVQNLFPQLTRIDTRQEGINYDMAAAYGIPDLHKWIDTYIRKVLVTFNVPAFGRYIQPGIKYDYNFANGRLVIREHKDLVKEVDSDAELAVALLRGDYLPYDERVRAERYIQENP